MKTFSERGYTLTAAAPYPCVPGQGCLVGHLFGVAKGLALAIGAIVVLELEGVYALAKHAGDTFNVGDLVYWDDVNHVVASTAQGNKLIGAAFGVAAGGDAAVFVRLNPVAQ